MSQQVPPVIESPKTIIGVGTRELVILGIGLVFAILCFIILPWLTLKIAFAVLFAALGVGVAFGRDPKTGNTLERYLIELFEFNSRPRFHQRGAGDYNPHQAFTVNVGSNEPIYNTEDSPKWGFFQMSPLDLGSYLFFRIFSLAFLAGLLTWIWTGGLSSVIKIYGMK